jgi:ligand-binding sensor domain-containing protein
MELHTNYKLFLSFLVVICFISVVAGSNTTPDQQPAVCLFRPGPDSIPSAQINAIINGLNGQVLVATPLGLSTYSDSWSTLHINRDNLSSGLMDNFVTALAYDNTGNLWIGYAGGIQIYNGSYFQTVNDQELLKSLQIRALQRWNDDMWIASGNAGLHRYTNGSWIWYEPFSQDGPGFFEADSMALDSATDTLLVATDHEGLWKVTQSNGMYLFEEIENNNDPYGWLDQVRKDPFGGVYFFNSTEVVHYDDITGFTLILSEEDFSGRMYNINDIAKGSGGNLYVATDNGIYVWSNGMITRHLGLFEGFGTNSPGIKRVFVDAKNRLWFSTLDNIGYYTGDVPPASLISIEMITPTPTPTPAQANITQPITSETNAQPSQPSLLDSIVNFFSGFVPFLHKSS